MIDVVAGGLDEPQVQALLAYHMANMHIDTPSENAHALGLDGLRDPAISFWSAWELDALLGVAALKELEPGHGEIKSMRTSPEHLRKGVSRALLNQILLTARDRNYTRLSLETGSQPFFAPARRLYERHGFKACAPFGSYQPDPASHFMTRTL